MRRGRGQRRPGSRRGMTLVEVVVAMTVLAIGIVGVLGAVSAALRSSAASAQYSVATLLADRVAAELERAPTLQSGQPTGSFEDEFSQYTWAADIGSLDQTGLQPVSIVVNWDDGNKSFHLYTELRPRSLPAASSSVPGATTGDTQPQPVTPQPGNARGGGGAGQ